MSGDRIISASHREHLLPRLRLSRLDEVDQVARVEAKLGVVAAVIGGRSPGDRGLALPAGGEHLLDDLALEGGFGVVQHGHQPTTPSSPSNVACAGSSICASETFVTSS